MPVALTQAASEKRAGLRHRWRGTNAAKPGSSAPVALIVAELLMETKV